ncbi:MAG TPA: SprB repeat-containing protein, partial [Saprospiraceae bacterium]|nr:SprB repeat-containing protein [Saprospiraceae bacterium]
AGTYTVTVTDAKSCTQTISATVTQPTDLLMTATVTQAGCGSGSGAIDVVVSGGTPPYVYAWSNGPSIPDLSGLAPGTYTLTVTDQQGCTRTRSEALGMKLDIAVLPAPTCTPGATGSLDLTVSQGSGGYTFQWSNGAAQEDLSDLPPGVYTVTVTESLGCTATLSATVTQPGILEVAAFALTPELCAGQALAYVKLDVLSGHAPPYELAWSNGSASGSRTGLTAEPLMINVPGAGQYTLTVTNAAGCSATATAVAVAKPALQLSTAVTMVACYAGATGSVDLSVTGGKPNFSHAWSNGGTTQDMSNLLAGVYTVTVTDALGCTARASVTIAQPERLSASVQVNSVTCFDGSNGQAEVTPKGGTPPYNYTWSNTTNTALIIGLGAGVYTVTLSDANGCTTTASAIITQPASSQTAPVLMPASQVPSSSCSASDGSLTLAEPVGSQAPYAFAWSNGPASGNGSGLVLSGLSAGFYQVTLTDAAGCTFTGGLAQGSPMLAVATPTPSTLCTASDGSIALSISGYTSTDFTYIWRRGGESGSGTAASADFVISNLPHGDYWVEVRDAAGCYAAVQARIEQGISTLNAAATAISTTCGQDNGTVVATASGGQSPFIYQWSTGWRFATLAPVPPGTYTVTVTEGGNGCTATASATVGGSTSTLADVTLTSIPVDCNKAEGKIVVNGTGIGPFNLQWWGSFSPGNVTTPTLPYTIPAYLANLYSVTVTDATGCSVVSGVEVAYSGAGVAASISSIVPPSSCTSADGSMQVLISGGIAPFSYTWKNGNLTGSGSGFSGPDMVIGGLSMGFTAVTVTDAQGCRDFFYENVPNASDFQVSATAFAPSTCGAQDGSIEVAVSGAAGSFAYQLYQGYVLHSSGSSGSPSFTLPNLPADQYRLIVESGQCTADLIGIVVPAVVMVMADFVTTPASCGGPSGSIDLSVTGGHAPYRYDWSNLPGTNDPQDLVNVKPGSYTVTITDLGGCTAAAAVELGGSSALYVYSNKTPTSSCTSTDGSITLFTSGGQPPYKFDWGHLSGSDDPKNLNGLAAGNYTVTVTDAAACTTTLSVQVLATQMQASASGLNTSCNGLPTGIISVDLSGASAVPPYTYAWARISGGGGNGSGSSATEPVHITGLFSGGYSITLTNGEGCTRILTASVGQGNGLFFQSAPIVQAVTCPGAADGSISITMAGGLPPYSYNWGGPSGFTSTQEDLTGLRAGVYRVTVTDASGCTFNSAAILVDSPAPISVSITALQAVTCFGGINGSIGIAVAGGQAPYGVQWSGPDGYTGSGTLLAGLKGGSYTLTVTDAKGCTYVHFPIVITSPTSAPSLAGNTCVVNNLGNIGLFVSNMSPPLDVHWAGPNGYTATGTLITNLQPGLYTATATDADGCTAVSAPIDAGITDAEINIAPKFSYINCKLVIIDATVASPFGDMEYQWNTGDISPYLTAPTIPGTFTLTVTNVLCGISATDTIQVKPCGQLAGSVLLDN